ncbi:MAG: hypothetical protein HKO10_10355 [Acidimicrobiia bacterium]|nr:hypothetical protein [Acidimicrobiia bacterium]
MSQERFSISPEEVGLMLSFATRPDRLTESVVVKLEEGVTFTELEQIVAWVGLPKSTAARLVHAQGPAGGSNGGSTGTRSGQIDTISSGRFRRHLTGILIVAAALTGVAVIQSQNWPRVLYLLIALAVVTYLIRRMIVRITTT